MCPQFKWFVVLRFASDFSRLTVIAVSVLEVRYRDVGDSSNLYWCGCCYGNSCYLWVFLDHTCLLC